jgi:hypothetical protein
MSHKRHPLTARWLCALAASLASCGDSIDLPAPPEQEQTLAIVQAYEMPTGSIDLASLDALTASVKARIEERRLDLLTRLVSEALAGLRERLDDSSIPADPAATVDTDRAVIDAVVKLTRICRGYGAEGSTPDEAVNGNIALTTTVVDSKLGEQIWGSFNDCRGTLAPEASDNVSSALSLFADGGLLIYLYGPLPVVSIDADFLARFRGDLGQQEGDVRSLDFDFRFIDRVIEFRHAVVDGEIIVGVNPAQFTLRGSNASYTCDFVERTCDDQVAPAQGE